MNAEHLPQFDRLWTDVPFRSDGDDAMSNSFGRNPAMRSGTRMVAFWLLLGGCAWAQDLPDGPLAAPGIGQPTASKANPARPAPTKTRKARTTHAAAAVPADPFADRLPERHPARAAGAKPVKATSADPLGLVLKWNGSNDNAEQTRIQNYSGTAAGTGASVGLRYHF